MRGSHSITFQKSVIYIKICKSDIDTHFWLHPFHFTKYSTRPCNKM